MSDMLGSIVGSVFGSHMQDSKNEIAIRNTKNELSQSFMDVLADADKRQNVSVVSPIVKPQTAADKFMKYQDMTMAEKIRASYLAEKHLTEEDVAAMSPEDRLKLEEEIAQRIREKLAESVRKEVNGEG